MRATRPPTDLRQSATRPRKWPDQSSALSVTAGQAQVRPDAASHREQGRVFVGPKGAALRRSNFRPVWNDACSKAELPGLHFHDLRHVGGTLAATTGASLKELMARLGHSSTRAALICQHATRDTDKAIALALGDLVREVRSAQSGEAPEIAN
jgi:integrase